MLRQMQAEGLVAQLPEPVEGEEEALAKMLGLFRELGVMFMGEDCAMLPDSAILRRHLIMLYGSDAERRSLLRIPSRSAPPSPDPRSVPDEPPSPIASSPTASPPRLSVPDMILKERLEHQHPAEAAQDEELAEDARTRCAALAAAARACNMRVQERLASVSAALGPDLALPTLASALGALSYASSHMHRAEGCTDRAAGHILSEEQQFTDLP